ncbi:MAG TPA: oligopeptide ABC transporter permease OppB [bacterium]|nr:oligopeptide ABC transporter permease OppB [bacterium]
MFRFIVLRLLGAIPVLLVIVTLSFFLMKEAPGGPFDRERALPPEVQKVIEERYHLNEPVTKQYLRYMGDLAHGDLGPSFKYKDRTVNEIIAQSLPVTIQLGGLALIFALLIGIPAGCIAALRQNSALDYATMSFSMIGVSVPNYVVLSVLIYVFAVKLNLVSVSGWGSPKQMICPVIALGLIYSAYIARLSRAGMLEVIRQDFVRTARAKGLYERIVIIRHCLKAGLLPVVSYLGPACAAILTGSLVIETISGIPGIGREFVHSALNRDYTLTMGTVILYSSFLIFFNLVVDVLYAYLDPRITYE